MNISVGGVIDIQTAITKDRGSEIYCACTVQSLIMGHRKSVKHSRNMTNQISPHTVE